MGDRLTDGLTDAARAAIEELPEEERELLAACMAAEAEEM